MAAKEVPDWVRRLYAGGELHVSEQRLSWNAVHIEQFLVWCRRAGDGADREDLGTLARVFLDELRQSSASDYRVGQAREVLAVFYRGISGWQMKRVASEEGRWWKPAFRLKTGMPSTPGLPYEEKGWNNTDIGNTLHNDIGYSGEDYEVVGRKVKVRGLGSSEEVVF